ncbi:uncharacterized protein LOC134676796 [Cydia fagiglandana]|uniref:uncharacterized protein LOC134676796 n=1 Tax=Cydia fagiglandana TaxID=1458189 RepID=UPI002FEE0E95
MHKFYKSCSVPLCKNTTKTTPSKLFVYVSLNKEIREKWLTLAKRDTACIPTSSMWFCEDHFDIPNDMENYMQYHLMGSVSKVHMKTGCIPTKFACQSDREQYITGHRDLSESPVHIKEETEDMQHCDCQMKTLCVDQIKEESSCSDEECSMSKTVTLGSLYTNHKPLCLVSTGYGVSEAEKLAEELKEEALCSDGMECGMAGMSESAMLAGADTDRDVKDELVLGSEHVKKEPSLSESVEYGMSEAAMLADVDTDHGVQDGLVLGSEHVKEEPSLSESVEYGMSEAAMLAGVDTDHGVQDGLVLGSQHVKEEPSLSESVEYGMSEAAMLAGVDTDHGVQDGLVLRSEHVKEEPSLSESVEYGMSEAAMLAGVDTDHDVQDGLVLRSEHVKEEPSLSESVEYGMSEAAILADLYADHVVKDELVLGSEHPHRPDVSLVGLESTSGFCDVQPLPHYLGDHNYPKESSTAVESTSIFCDVQPLPHYLGDHNYAKEFSTAVVFEEKPSQERVLSRNSPLALRDCCVRLERLQHHEALAGNDTTHTDTESDTENIYARDCIINNRTTTSGTDNDNENIYARDCKRMFICDLCGKKFALKKNISPQI